MNIPVVLVAASAVLGGVAAASAGWLPDPLARVADHAGHALTAAIHESTERGTPTAADALTRLERLESVHVKSIEGFNPENGVQGGSGTLADPFVFEGFYTPRMTIENVAAAYVIRDVYVSGTLRLDYTGETARVERSTIGFLLTDTNRPHDAPHTWLDVRDNALGAARIRHAGGVFADNVVGAPGAFDPDRLALEVQGYNGLTVSGNVVHGPAEFRLHGHHYSPSYDEAWAPAGHDHGDPAVRYHDVVVSGNEFRDASGRGVAISDRDHQANHATAKSAPDERLNDVHLHRLRFTFEHNLLVGAGLVIEQPNAPHEKHTGGEATILARGNVVSDPLGGIGIEVRGARGANVDLADNIVQNLRGRVDASAGILIRNADGGSIAVRGGSIQGFEHGVRARDVTAATTWSVEAVANHDVGRDLYWDRTVKTPPKGYSASGAADAPHAHAHR